MDNLFYNHIGKNNDFPIQLFMLFVIVSMGQLYGISIDAHIMPHFSMSR